MTRYRIVNTQPRYDTCPYTVEAWRPWWPFWTYVAFAMTLEAAEKKCERLLNPVVKVYAKYP